MKIVEHYVPIMDTEAEGYAKNLEHYIGKSRIFDIPESIREKFKNKEATIVDIGTGKGKVVEAMRRKGYKFFGIDYSSIIGAGKSGEGKARADARQLPFGDETIDIIVSMGLVDEILYKQGGGDYENIINEIVRVLVREGVYLTTGADFHWSDVYKQKILELEQQGKIRIKRDEFGDMRNIVKL